MITRLISIAPMMDCTDRHYRYFMRLISKRVLLYTEMITTGALLCGDRERFLQFDAREHPVALQLGGSCPAELAKCAKIVADHGYDEVNLNVGCPSDRVQSGRFGACLMAEPELVAECVAAMVQAVNIPVTVKTRIGIDKQDSYEELQHFIKTVANAGCEVFIIHARKAWLKGLNPKQNRTVPPLRYEIVRQIKQDFPKLQIVINGEIADLDQAQQHHINLDGVMIGREAYRNPYLFAEVDQKFYGVNDAVVSPFEVMQNFIPYVAKEMAQGTRLSSMTRHVLGLFQGMRGAKAWRRALSEGVQQQGANFELLQQATTQLMRG